MPKKKKEPIAEEELGTGDLRVLELKNFLPEIKLPRPIDPRLPDVPGVMLLVMKVKSGKSNLMSWMLLSEKALGGKKPIFDLIYIISPTAKIDRSSQAYFREEFNERIIVFDDLENLDGFLRNILEYQQSFDIKSPEEDERPPRVGIFFDDISGYLKRNSLVTHLFTRYRHYNLSLFCANQTCRDLPTAVRSQATSLWLSSCYSVVERTKILEEWGDLYKNRLEPVWDYCCKERYNYCYLKLDDIEPRVFKAGKDGFQEIDYMNFNGETNAETEDKNAENIMDANYIPKENE
tara:strand:+ start:165 stop:1040 length:876 start_codon:yes stop_codon:yes gene_type:complete